MLVTGGDTGMGEEIIRELFKHNSKVYMAARSREKALAAIAELKTETGKEAHFIELDLSSLASVRKTAEEFLSKEEALHALFNNAGVVWAAVRDVTADGYDLQLGMNVLAPFFLSQLLLPALLRGIVSSSDGSAHGPKRRRLSEFYNQSKLADVLVAYKLVRRYGEQGFVAAQRSRNVETGLMRQY
ncbi:NAD(P)-binding protein [Polyporus arcularius HHB13444]|uniref:NAD(P)-binding protein n=1 Tax=Polyporus arcularius HHB13444 TaxID=1314778 RepID=A0A5C3P7N3_9APHY|nr:NAD(P)-binding protein [Polyporus arcularius HHB13444]